MSDFEKQRIKERRIITAVVFLLTVAFVASFMILVNMKKDAALIDPKACVTNQDSYSCQKYCKTYPNSEGCEWYQDKH